MDVDIAVSGKGEAALFHEEQDFVKFSGVVASCVTTKLCARRNFLASL